MNKELLKLYAKKLIEVQIEWLKFENQFNAEYRKSFDLSQKLVEIKKELEKTIDYDIDNDNLKFPIEIEVKSELICSLSRNNLIDYSMALCKVPFDDFVKLGRVKFIKEALFKNNAIIYDEMSNYLRDKEKDNSESLLSSNISLLRSVRVNSNKKFDNFSYDMMEYYYEELGIGLKEDGSIDQALIELFNHMTMITIVLMKLEGKSEYSVLVENLMREELLIMNNSTKDVNSLDFINNIINMLEEYNELIANTGLRKKLNFENIRQSSEKVMKKQ